MGGSETKTTTDDDECECVWKKNAMEMCLGGKNEFQIGKIRNM